MASEFEEDGRRLILFVVWGVVIGLSFAGILYYGSRPPITCIDGVIHEEISKDVFVKSVPERECVSERAKRSEQRERSDRGE